MTGRRALLVLSAVALVPAMAGPVRAAVPTALVVPLCNGGTATIPLGNRDGDGKGGGGQPNAPCCAKACHSGDRRRPLDRKQ